MNGSSGKGFDVIIFILISPFVVPLPLLSLIMLLVRRPSRAGSRIVGTLTALEGLGLMIVFGNERGFGFLIGFGVMCLVLGAGQWLRTVDGPENPPANQPPYLIDGAEPAVDPEPATTGGRGLQLLVWGIVLVLFGLLVSQR